MGTGYHDGHQLMDLGASVSVRVRRRRTFSMTLVVSFNGGKSRSKGWVLK